MFQQRKTLCSYESKKQNKNKLFPTSHLLLSVNWKKDLPYDNKDYHFLDIFDLSAFLAIVNSGSPGPSIAIQCGGINFFIAFTYLTITSNSLFMLTVVCARLLLTGTVDSITLNKLK